jgi:hypothetical protein
MQINSTQEKMNTYKQKWKTIFRGNGSRKITKTDVKVQTKRMRDIGRERIR